MQKYYAIYYVLKGWQVEALNFEPKTNAWSFFWESFWFERGGGRAQQVLWDVKTQKTALTSDVSYKLPQTMQIFKETYKF